jgi:nicotinate-nucleotide adenylyltransferase
MRIGILGGAFDPIHLGHLAAAEAAYTQAGLDEVWFMPSYVPPLKENQTLFDSEKRLAMVQLAVQEHPHFKVSDLELKRSETSYTIDTVEQLSKLFPDTQFSWIIGADRLNDLMDWKQIDELAARITFIGFGRAGYVVDIDDYPEWLRSRIQLVEMAPMAISSTAIRAQLDKPEDVRGCLPAAVYTYLFGEKE